jgi:positive regulator of sigma E activity
MPSSRYHANQRKKGHCQIAVYLPLNTLQLLDAARMIYGSPSRSVFLSEILCALLGGNEEITAFVTRMVGNDKSTRLSLLARPRSRSSPNPDIRR